MPVPFSDLDFRVLTMAELLQRLLLTPGMCLRFSVHVMGTNPNTWPDVLVAPEQLVIVPRGSELLYWMSDAVERTLPKGALNLLQHLTPGKQLGGRLVRQREPEGEYINLLELNPADLVPNTECSFFVLDPTTGEIVPTELEVRGCVEFRSGGLWRTTRGEIWAMLPPKILENLTNAARTYLGEPLKD